MLSLKDWAVPKWGEDFHEGVEGPPEPLLGPRSKDLRQEQRNVHVQPSRTLVSSGFTFC